MQLQCTYVVILVIFGQSNQKFCLSQFDSAFFKNLTSAKKYVYEYVAVLISLFLWKLIIQQTILTKKIYYSNL